MLIIAIVLQRDGVVCLKTTAIQMDGNNITRVNASR